MVINSKLIIGRDILKNISTQNWPNCTLYITPNQTAPHHTYAYKIDVQYGYSFG